jgi:uncharacterized membrane protein YbhN (UPF0104 family)
MGRSRWIAFLFRAGLLCAVGVIAFLHREGIGQALVACMDLDVVVVLVLPLFVFWNWLAALGWLDLHRMFTHGPAPSAWKLSLVRLQAQAVNLVLPLASVGGEVLRATILSRRNGQVAGTTSAVVLDKIADAAAGVAFAIIGITIGFGHGIDVLAIVVLASMLVLFVGGLPFLLRGHGGRLGRVIARHRNELSPIIDSPGLVSRSFYRALGWHMLERILMAGEIYLAMRAVGINVGVVDAVFVAAMMTAYSLVFFFIPGQVGAIEAGIVSAFTSLGLPPTTGLTVALVRRARQLGTIAVGTILFVVGKREQDAPMADGDPEEKRCD